MEGKGIYLRRWSRMAELTVVLATVLGGVAVAVTEKLDDSDSSSSPRRRDTRPLRFTPSVLFSSFSSFASLGLSVDIPDFRFLLFRFLLSQHCRFLSLGFPPHFLSFFPSPPFLFCVRVVFIEAGGAGRPCPIPSPPMHGVHVAYFATAPTAVANGGVACETRLLWHLIMRWVASDFGSKARGRKRQGEENKTFLPLLHVQGKKKKKQCRLKTTPFRPFFFVFSNAWNDIVLL